MLSGPILNQRTNGPVNAHLISGPSISTKHTNLKNQGQEMTLTFNTHLYLLIQLFRPLAATVSEISTVTVFPFFYRKA